jgi:hypothetical protein
MKMQLKVTNLDGSAVDVPIIAADLVGFEETYNRSIARFEHEFKYTDICWLSWHALKRGDKSLPEFSKWIETIESASFSESDDLAPLGNSPSTS